MDKNKAMIVFLLLGTIFGYLYSSYNNQPTAAQFINNCNNVFGTGMWNVTKINNSWSCTSNTNLFYDGELFGPPTEIDNLLYNGIYGWFCDDDNSYEPAISDVKQRYLDRKCHLVDIDIGSVNRSYYLENGWD